ncbi:MAG: hypothetical protein HKN60_06860 [Rhizobiales bacterium]|nr:hypothetical protein [Hyphomicrobiales bacterium]
MGNAPQDPAQSPSDKDRQILARMIASLQHLDFIGASIAAAHLDQSIEAYCRQFDLDRTQSESE